ncbi:MAG: hypothetical protein KDJ69_15435 [Nitratireductor sp.]|nr:hypothetical protein [Nitratireductor sp.]
MADYVSIIAKAVSALAENTAANRQVIYQKARDTIDRKLRAMDPLPAEAAIAAQMQQLETAIGQVEASEQAEAAAQAIDEIPATPPPVETAPAAPTAPQAGLASVLPEAADTPILIDGIGDKTLLHLADEGVTTISQIAAMSDGELALLTEKIGIPGFEKTQEWKEQANALLAGDLPRSKTDQERLRKMLEEADNVPATPVPEEPVASEPEPAAPMPAPAEPMPAPAVSAAPPPAEPEISTADEMAPPLPAQSAPPPGVSAEPELPTVPLSSASRPVDPVPEPVSIESVPEIPAAELPAAQPPVAARMEQPAPDRSPATPAGQPDYVSELDGDPAFKTEPMASRPLPPPRRKGGAGKVIGWLSAILLVGAAGAGAYYYQDEVKQAGAQAVSAVSGMIEDFIGGDSGGTATAPEEEPQEEAQAGEGEPEKDTSRLGNGGSTSAAESTQPVQETPAEPTEQTAVRDVTPPETEQTPVVESDEPVQLVEPADGGNATVSEENTAEPAAENGGESVLAEAKPGAAGNEDQPAILAGEKAFLYEEGFGTNGASRDDGAVSWTLANEPPEDGAQPEAVIKGTMEVPARGLQLNLTIKRNVDAALPASHIIELFFTVPPGFSGGNIDQISRFVMKSTEQARGESLVGVPARIDAGYFLIALNNLEQAQQTNLGLLETANWIDVPITYLTGRRGLVTLEKGPVGKKVFSDALADWRNR